MPTPINNYDAGNQILKNYIDNRANSIIIENYYESGGGTTYLLGTGIKASDVANYSVYYTDNSSTPTSISSTIGVDGNGIWSTSFTTPSNANTLFIANSDNTKVSGPWVLGEETGAEKPTILNVYNYSGSNYVYANLPGGMSGWSLYGLGDSSSINDLGSTWSSSSDLYYLTYSPSSYPVNNLFIAKYSSSNYTDISNVWNLGGESSTTPIIGNLYISGSTVYATGLGIPNGDSSYNLYAYTSGSATPTQITGISSPSSDYWSTSGSLSSSYTYTGFFVAKNYYVNPSEIWLMTSSENNKFGVVGAVSESGGTCSVYGLAPRDGGSYYLYYWYLSSGSLSYSNYNVSPSSSTGEYSASFSVYGQLVGIVLTEYESSAYTPISDTYVVPSTGGSSTAPSLIAVSSPSPDNYNAYYQNVPSDGSSYYIYYNYTDSGGSYSYGTTSASSGSGYASISLSPGYILLSVYVVKYDSGNYVPVSNIYRYGG